MGGFGDVVTRLASDLGSVNVFFTYYERLRVYREPRENATDLGIAVLRRSRQFSSALSPLLLRHEPEPESDRIR